LILGFAIGWYAWGTATAAVVIGKYFELSQGSVLVLMVLFGLLFCATAYVGYRGLEILSYIAVHGLAAVAIDVGGNGQGRRTAGAAGGGAER
jgi:cytosine permease